MINPKAAPCDEAAIRSIPSAANCVDRQKPWVLLATILASSITYIDESVVNIALPTIESSLGASVAVIQWVVNAYTLCLSALLLSGGAAADRFGRRKMFIIGIILFAAASLWCGFAPTIAQLILARALQGVGAAVLIPCSLALIGASFDEEERGKAIGTWAGVSAIAVAIGPLLGGLIVDHFSWRWIFLINPLLALPTIWIVYRHVPESHDREVTGRLDWTGAVLVLLGLADVCYGLIAAPEFGLSDIRVVMPLAVGLLLLCVFIWLESHSGTPMLPLDLFKSRTFAAVNLLTLLLYAALGGAFFFLPFALIQVSGYSAVLAGAAFLPFTIIMGLLSRWTGARSSAPNLLSLSGAKSDNSRRAWAVRHQPSRIDEQRWRPAAGPGNYPGLPRREHKGHHAARCHFNSRCRRERCAAAALTQRADRRGPATASTADGRRGSFRR